MVSWPYEYDSLVNPTATDKTNSSSVPHAQQHADLNDIVEAIQKRQGRASTAVSGSSAVSTSPGDVFHVTSSNGHTNWGPKAKVALVDSLSGSTATTISLSSIPQTYRNLELTISARNDTTGNGILGLGLQFNGDTSTNYFYEIMIGNGSSLSAIQGLKSTQGLGGGVMGGAAPAGRVAFSHFQIPNYASTAQHKNYRSYVTGLDGDGSTSASTAKFFFGGGYWQSTAAITSITLVSGGGAFAAGTRVTLYGEPSTV